MYVVCGHRYPLCGDVAGSWRGQWGEQHTLLAVTLFHIICKRVTVWRDRRVAYRERCSVVPWSAPLPPPPSSPLVCPLLTTYHYVGSTVVL